MMRGRSSWLPLFVIALLIAGCKHERRHRPRTVEAITTRFVAAQATDQPLIHGERKPLPAGYWNVAGYWEYDCTVEDWNSDPCAAIAMAVSDAELVELTPPDQDVLYYHDEEDLRAPGFGLDWEVAVDHDFRPVDAHPGAFIWPLVDHRDHLVAVFPPRNGPCEKIDLVRWRASEVKVLPVAAIQTSMAAAGLGDERIAQVTVREVIDHLGVGATRRWLVTLRLRTGGIQTWSVNVTTGETRLELGP